jgi:hypothetical protein
MSETDYPPDLRAILARIDRDTAEATKLRQESNKFIAEQQKLFAEQLKLGAEQQKLNRDRWLAPWLAIAGLVGGVLAIANFIARAFGVG